MFKQLKVQNNLKDQLKVKKGVWKKMKGWKQLNVENNWR